MLRKLALAAVGLAVMALPAASFASAREGGPSYPSPPPGYAETYSHNFSTQGMGDWAVNPYDDYGSPVISDSARTGGLGIGLTTSRQVAEVISGDAVVMPGAFIQAQAYLPGTANGEIANWPSFFAIARPNGLSTPTAGEIDLVEGLSGQACWHVHSMAGGPGGCAPVGRYSGWHTFSALWTGGVVTFWYDNAEVGSEPLATTAPLSLIFEYESAGAPYSSPWYGGPALYPAADRLGHVQVWELK
jgi:hypothetical protein